MSFKISQIDLFIDECEQSLIEKCLENRWLTEGPFAKKFQEALGAQTGAKHVCFAPNGTLGLYLALLALELDPGSEIVLPTFTFYASATAAVFAGLKPVFVDVDPNTFNATPQAFESAIGPRTRAFMPVHIYGQACDVEGILSVARRNGIRVVEDAAQALGVTLNGKAAGTFGDIGVYSLFADKVITSGEGGVVVTDADDLAAKLNLLRNQGRPNSGTFVHPSLGMNFRITDIQAAIGLAQIDKLPKILADRTRKWQFYSSGLKGVGDIQLMSILPGSSLIMFRFPFLTSEREGLTKHLEDRGIQTRGFFYPLHLQPKLRNSSVARLPVAESLYERGICLPVHYHLSESQMSEIIDAIRSYFGS
jgi:perosamine synthetase